MSKKITITQDGNKVCVLKGVNLQDGIAGFGDTAKEAWESFYQQLLKENEISLPHSDPTITYTMREIDYSYYRGGIDSVLEFYSAIDKLKGLYLLLPFIDTTPTIKELLFKLIKEL